MSPTRNTVARTATAVAILFLAIVASSPTAAADPTPPANPGPANGNQPAANGNPSSANGNPPSEETTQDEEEQAVPLDIAGILRTASSELKSIPVTFPNTPASMIDGAAALLAAVGVTDLSIAAPAALPPAAAGGLAVLPPLLP